MSADLETDQLDSRPDQQANFYDLIAKGRLLNDDKEFSQEAFDLFAEASTLKPDLPDAWVELSKCYQKKVDIDGAIDCLESALKNCDVDRPDKVVLRQLATCIRQKRYDTPEANIAAVLRSLDLSKQALKADLKDEESYYNLAKAYMCLFFATECVDQQVINISRATFTKALSMSNEGRQKRAKASGDDNEIVTCQAKLGSTDSHDKQAVKPLIEQTDFLYNYSSVLVYFQEFQKALEFLKTAIELDRDWDEPKNMEECLTTYLTQIKSLITDMTKHNKRFIKRFSKVVEVLKNVTLIERVIENDQKRLRKALDVQVKSVTIDQLCDAGIQSRISKSNEIEVELLHIKLVCMVNCNQAMYLTFIAVDQNNSLVVVTIHNLAASRCPSPKDIVTIVNPKIEKIEVSTTTSTGQNIEVEYERVAVREFKELYVNGDRIATDQVSTPKCVVAALP